MSRCSQYKFGPITGNVAAGSSDVTQNYNAGFDITKVREFADLVTEIGGLLGLEDGRQAVLSAATSELHDAIEDPKADKGPCAGQSTRWWVISSSLATRRSGMQRSPLAIRLEASSILRSATYIFRYRSACSRSVIVRVGARGLVE